MKVLTVLVSFLVIFLTTSALQSKDEISPCKHIRPSECCFAYVTHRIPRVQISHYYETSSQCAMPGFIFVTKKDRYICANPSDAWVQDCIKGLQKKSVSGGSTFRNKGPGNC